MAPSAKDDYDYYKDEKTVSKIGRKAKESPFVVVGIAGLVGACAYGAFRWRTKGPSVTTSAFLMQLRVVAQGTFLGCIVLGLVAQIAKEQFSSPDKETSKLESKR